MSIFKISVSLGNLPALKQAINDQTFPLLSQAVRAVAQAAQADWMKAIDNAKLWSGEKDKYRESVQWKSTGPLSAHVWSDYKNAYEIDNGRPARDLKRMLDTSLKVRVTKTGSRYLIIPFRHNTEGNNAHAAAMPSSVAQMAAALKPSSITGQTRRISGTGAYGIKSRMPLTVNQNTYQWGSSLGRGVGPRYAGMKRFDTSSGASKSSAYLTFRVMSERSNGWIIPAKPGLNLVKGVADELRPKAEQAFGMAMAKLRMR